VNAASSRSYWEMQVQSAALTGKSSEFELVSPGATRILQAALRQDVSLQELSKLAAGDPGFAVRLLGTVNSAAYRGSSAVSDLAQAIALLGIRGTRAIALGLVVSDLAPNDRDGSVLMGNCLRRALAARSLARALKMGPGDDQFTIGLLLDAGLMMRAGGTLVSAAEIGRSPAHERVLREHTLGRARHTNMGAALAERLQFPPGTAEAIRRHHDPDMPTEPLAAIAWVAERIAGVFEGGMPQFTRMMAVEAGAKLGLAESDVDQILQELPSQVAEAAAAFNHNVGAQPAIDDLINNARQQLGTLARQYGELVQALNRVVTEKEQLTEQLRQANLALAQQATTDALTELPNRRAFDEALARDLARAQRQTAPLSLAVLDVDHFKMFNDKYGHATGDIVLKAVGHALAACVRSGDIAARYGGEEFAVILPGTDLQGALIAGERLRKAIAEKVIESAHGKLGVTVSVGIVCYRPGTGKATCESLFERADQALYRAKQQGRNRVVGA
jgi:diguanylate cyclase (GGDEF)-like protein